MKFKSLLVLVASLFLSTFTFAADQKLIALTFDDGPRPYVLYGRGTPQPTISLLDLLDKNNAKATFFVMGWRLTPKTYGEAHEYRIDKSCLDAAREVLARGHEIENHTYSHVELRQLERKKGEAAAVADVDHGAAMIKAVTGKQPLYVRPPLWALTPELRRDLTSHGYHILTIAGDLPPAVRDINSEDYLCAGSHPVHCPKPSLVESVMRTIEQRERHGVYTHIIAFHELTTTAAALNTLLPELRARGYQFVRLDQYMQAVEGKSHAKEQLLGK